MKRYNEYTELELANMTSEQISNLIDIECMAEGAPISVQKPIYVDVPEIDPPKESVYYLDVGSVFLLSQEEAEALKKVIDSLKTRVRTEYSYGMDYRKKYIMPFESVVSIKKEKYYSKDAYFKISDDLEAISKAEKINSEREELYNKSLEKRKKIELEVMEAYYESLDYKRNVEEAKKMYEKYIELAEGNVEVAEKFFEKTEYYDFIDVIKEESK